LARGRFQKTRARAIKKVCDPANPFVYRGLGCFYGYVARFAVGLTMKEIKRAREGEENPKGARADKPVDEIPDPRGNEVVESDLRDLLRRRRANRCDVRTRRIEERTFIALGDLLFEIAVTRGAGFLSGVERAPLEARLLKGVPTRDLAERELKLQNNKEGKKGTLKTQQSAVANRWARLRDKTAEEAVGRIEDEFWEGLLGVGLRPREEKSAADKQAVIRNLREYSIHYGADTLQALAEYQEARHQRSRPKDAAQERPQARVVELPREGGIAP